MKTTYRRIAESQDIFRRLSEIPLNIMDAERLKQGIVELDLFYGKIDKFHQENVTLYGKEEYEKEYNDFLNQEIELENFPIEIACGESVFITALDLIRIGNLIHFNS